MTKTGRRRSENENGECKRLKVPQRQETLNYFIISFFFILLIILPHHYSPLSYAENPKEDLNDFFSFWPSLSFSAPFLSPPLPLSHSPPFLENLRSDIPHPSEICRSLAFNLRKNNNNKIVIYTHLVSINVADSQLN